MTCSRRRPNGANCFNQLGRAASWRGGIRSGHSRGDILGAGGGGGFWASLHPFAVVLIVRNHLITTLPPLSADCAIYERGISGGERKNSCDNHCKRGQWRGGARERPQVNMLHRNENLGSEAYTALP